MHVILSLKQSTFKPLQRLNRNRLLF